MVHNDYEMGESDRVTHLRVRQDPFKARLASTQGGMANYILSLGVCGLSFYVFYKKIKPVNNQFVSILASAYIAIHLGHLASKWAIYNLGDPQELKYLVQSPSNFNVNLQMNQLKDHDNGIILNRYS